MVKEEIKDPRIFLPSLVEEVVFELNPHRWEALPQLEVMGECFT